MALGMVCASILQSCKTRTLAVDRYVPVPYIVHDTVKQHQLTEQEKQAMFNKFFDLGFQRAAGPRFDKMQDVILTLSKNNAKQAASIQHLSDVILSMRARSIRRNDSMNIENNKLKNDILTYQRQTALSQKQQVTQNAEQIKKLNGITDFLLVGFVSMWVLMILCGIALYLWWKRMKANIKRLNYV